MNGKKAKQLRREVYGEEFSPKFRSYTYVGRTRHADDKRQEYQRRKHNAHV